jgi:hypothetical protein
MARIMLQVLRRGKFPGFFISTRNIFDIPCKLQFKISHFNSNVRLILIRSSIMKKLMKFAAASVVAMGVGITANAQAAPCATMTMAQWFGLGATGCTDPVDGDSTWVLNSYGDGSGGNTDIGNATVNVSEAEIGGADYYTVDALLSGSGLTNGQQSYFNYTETGDILNIAKVDSTVGPGTANASKTITTGLGGITTISSADGVSSGFTALNSPSDTLTTNVLMTTGAVAGVGGQLTAVHDNYAYVPEPGSILLLGIGLTALVIGRQKVMTGAI